MCGYYCLMWAGTVELWLSTCMCASTGQLAITSFLLLWFKQADKSSAVAEMGDSLATIDGPKSWGRLLYLFFRGAGSPSNTVWPGARSTSVPSGILIHPAVWPQQTWAKNWGSCALLGELDPHLTQYRLGWGLPPYQVASLSTQPFGHSRHGPRFIQKQALPASVNFQSGGCCATFRGMGSWVPI